MKYTVPMFDEKNNDQNIQMSEGKQKTASQKHGEKSTSSHKVIHGLKSLGSPAEMLDTLASGKEKDSSGKLSIDRARDNILTLGDPRIDAFYDAMEGSSQLLLFHYTTPDAQTLFYAGTVHQHNLTPEEQHEQQKGLENAFKEFQETTKDNKKRLVMIEGSKPGFLVASEETLDEAMQKGEMAGILWMAKHAGIPAVSPDIPQEETLRFMKEEGVADITIALNFALRTVHTAILEKQRQGNTTFTQEEVLDVLFRVQLVQADWEKEAAIKALAEIKAAGAWSSVDGRAKAQEYIDNMLPKLNNHLKENSQFIKNDTTGEKGIDLLVQQGTDNEGNPLFISPYIPEKHYQALSNPFITHPDNPKGMLNYLSAKLSDNRDRYIITQVVQKANEGYDLFIGFGNSHAIQEGQGLIAAGCISPDYPSLA